MLKIEEGRVLNRQGARELTTAEYLQVGAGEVSNNNCTFNAKTCTMDGDCPVPIRCPI